MKGIYGSLMLIILFVACAEKQPKEYVSLSGKVTNKKGDVLRIMGRNFQKEITLEADGSFSDTLKVVPGFHGFMEGNSQSFIYLNNGYELNLTFDQNDFPNSINFEGEGSKTNQYLVEKLQFVQEEKLDNYALIFELEKEDFDARINGLQKQLNDMLTNADGLEEEVRTMEQEANAKLIEFYTSNYEAEHQVYARLKKGAPSPSFSYPDTEGNLVSLEDLKGKYVYVDVWATWCGPCKQEIPFLKEMDATYKDTNLAIVSLSIDQMKHKDKWLQMIKDEQLTGIHVLADNDWNSEFVQAYSITGIPRFILIDTEGNIISANAPRPSDPALKEMLSTLNL